MQIDDKSAHFNYNPWARYGFRWTEQEKAEIERNLDAFMKKANADYEIELEEAFRPDGTSAGYHNIVRSDTKEVIGSKPVTQRYKPMRPMDLVEAIRPLAEEGWITPDAFFTMGEGTKEVLVCRIDAGQIPDEAHDIDGSERIWYLGMRNLQGKGKASGDITTIREICENTEAAAAAQWSWKVAHTGNPQERVKEAVAAWSELKVQIRKVAERFRLFADAQCDFMDAKGLVQDILELNAEAVKMREEVGGMFEGKQLPGASTAGIRMRDEILSAFNRPANGTYGRSLQDLRNAVTDTLSHWTAPNSRQADRKIAEQHLDIGGTRYAVEARADLVLARAIGKPELLEAEVS